jgi:predicted PurR-regulated permease PerM
MTKVLPRLREKKEAVDIIREIESQISRYLGTVVLINLCEGTAVAMAMWLVGMPNPVLWGVLAGVANFVPYLGALSTATVLGVVGLLTFDSLGRAFLPVACYVTINFIEGNFISPMIVGKALTLNAGSVFMALMLWGFLWGIPGFLLAVPILMTVTILCSRVPALAPISEFFRD